MTSHPRRRPRGGTAPSPLLLLDLRTRAGLTQADAAELLGVGDKTWRDWEAGRRRMPAGMMELLCILMAVGTVEGGPYIAPGDWMRPWVRDVLCLWFRRPLDPALTRLSAPPHAVEAASLART